jgi:Fur family ferric uptake transcriptional regulator
VSELSAVKVAVSPQDKFREYLYTKSHRLTPERTIIVDEVFASHEHFDADELVSRLSTRSDGKRVSRSSVYRTLTLLEEAGLLRKVARTNGREVFEHDYGYPQHGHLICRKCGSLEEFASEVISNILDDVAREHSFHLTGHRLEVYGTCSNCHRPRQRRHRKLDMI